MAGWTNRGKYACLLAYFQADATYEPTAFAMALATSATAPNADDNVMADLTECPNGNGYTTGGETVARNGTDFDSETESDASDYAETQIKDIVWTASGGNMPSTAARYAVLLDNDTTPNLIIYWDLSSDRQVSDTQTLTIQDAAIRLTES